MIWWVSAMSKQRIRRRGTAGKDVVLDVDLGPGRVVGSGSVGATPMGQMQPILPGRSHGLGRLGAEDAWAVSRRFVITSRKQRTSQRWHEPRQNNP